MFWIIKRYATHFVAHVVFLNDLHINISNTCMINFPFYCTSLCAWTRTFSYTMNDVAYFTSRRICWDQGQLNTYELIELNPLIKKFWVFDKPWSVGSGPSLSSLWLAQASVAQTLKGCQLFRLSFAVSSLRCHPRRCLQCRPKTELHHLYQLRTFWYAVCALTFYWNYINQSSIYRK